MDSMFRPVEVRQMFDLSDPHAKSTGHIRGPYPDWTISGQVLAGRFTSINGPFNARGKVTIGRYCAFGQYVSMVSGNHRTDMPNQQIWLHQRFGFRLPTETKGPIEIGHNVWIGDKATVLSGARIGHGAVIAAGAVVTGDIAPFTIAAGSPAKPIRPRFTKSVIAQLLDLRWWSWREPRIARNRVFFETIIPPDQDIDLVSLVVD